MAQKKPKQSPEGIRAELKSLGVTPADSDRIFRFVNALSSTSPEMPSLEDCQSAASFIFELIVAAQQGENWEKYKKQLGLRKLTDKRFYPKFVRMDDPEYIIVRNYVNDPETYTHKETCEKLIKLHPMSISQAENCIREIKQRFNKP